MNESKDIGNDTAILVDIPGGDSEYEYRIGTGVQCTLVLRAFRVPASDVRMRVRLMGEGAGATILGFVIAADTSAIRLHTMQIHEARDTSSNLLIKAALYDHAQCFVEGGIRVEKKAQKTDAYQRNENLLLSRTAHAESKPSLEILANDVRCTHGATIGPVSDEELWYLATRGIPRHLAEPLITAGFFRKAADLIPDPEMRETVWKSVDAAL